MQGRMVVSFEPRGDSITKNLIAYTLCHRELTDCNVVYREFYEMVHGKDVMLSGRELYPREVIYQYKSNTYFGTFYTLSCRIT